MKKRNVDSLINEFLKRYKVNEDVNTLYVNTKPLDFYIYDINSNLNSTVTKKLRGNKVNISFTESFVNETFMNTSECFPINSQSDFKKFLSLCFNLSIIKLEEMGFYNDKKNLNFLIKKQIKNIIMSKKIVEKYSKLRDELSKDDLITYKKYSKTINDYNRCMKKSVRRLRNYKLCFETLDYNINTILYIKYISDILVNKNIVTEL